MTKNVLSIIPYYGGKAKLAPLICDMIDYENTDIYIEPFGGGARVLLNKPRHKRDIYCDSSLGLNALFECLSKNDTALKLIDDLLQTEPSEELFNWALKYRNSFDDDLAQIALDELKAFVKEICYKCNTPKDYLKFVRYNLDYDVLHKKMSETEWEIFLALSKKYLDVFNKDGVINSAGISYYDNLQELAKATFIVYQLSYSGNGKGISKMKIANVDAYYRAVNNLYETMERLEGIQTVCADAQIAFFKNLFNVKDVADKNTIFSMSRYLNDERVMMYLDPSYLKPEDEKKDLGVKFYKQSWSASQHKAFLKLIRDAKCRILLSNYDLQLYDDYLLDYKNWHRLKIDTTTSFASKSSKDNSRTEVIWYNY